MAIKKRTQQERDREARIEAFGAAAEPRASEAVVASVPEPVAQAATPLGDRRPAPTGGEPRTWPKNALIRYPNDELPRLLAEVAALEERTHHATTLRALRRGLEILREEHRR